jgi:hypothetical protein
MAQFCRNRHGNARLQQLSARFPRLGAVRRAFTIEQQQKKINIIIYLLVG